MTDQELFAAMDAQQSDIGRKRRAFHETAVKVATFADIADEGGFDGPAVRLMREALSDFRVARNAYLADFSKEKKP